jgi:hypothetical protein
MQNILNTKKLYDWLEKIDKELAQEVSAGGCDHCGGVLHRGDYARKPRGVKDGGEAIKHWDKRASFCCAREGCRKRHTPSSVRFLGRKVYVGVVIVLVAAMMHGPKGRRIAVLHEALGIDKRTLLRWRDWWLEDFVHTPFWKANRARLMPVLEEALMPYCLVESFNAEGREGLIKLMEFLSPITTRSGKGVVAM